MIFFAVLLQATAYYLRQFPLVLVIAALALFAFRGWVKSLRGELPVWRSALGITSIIIIFINSAVLGVSVLLAMAHTNIHALTGDWMLGVTLLVFLSICFGFALRGISRVEIVLAGLLSALLLVVNVRI